MIQFEQEWIKGGVSLGAAAGWTADEIRLVSELGYALAEQGRNNEAITIFEGLVALAPATAYFETALGALWLRENEPARALPHLNAALAADANDITTRVNRGEVFLLLGNFEGSREDLKFVLRQQIPPEKIILFTQCQTRARALLTAVERFSAGKN
ncbi:MAG: tetratricopeptide repeat protein [Pyrinomonadaceae bacterium]